MINHVLLLSIILFTWALFADNFSDETGTEVLNLTVVLPPSPQPISAVKSATLVTTQMGDARIDSESKLHYDVAFQVGRGPIQHAKIPADRIIAHVSEMEKSARIKKLPFTVVSISKLKY